VAYGVREEVKGTFRTSYYARDIDGGLFRSVWPNAHPSFVDGEGTASFTDLMGFEWAADGDHNVMVALHKSKREEVLMETMNVRFTGPGSQHEPAIAPDGTRIVVVSENNGNSDLWVSDTVDQAPVLQLTFSQESERSPKWHPRLPRIIHEVRNPLGGDIYFFDLDSFEHTALIRWGTSDEADPSYEPGNGERFAFLSNRDAPDGLRFDLFVATPGDPLPKPVIRNIRRSDKSKGYCWDPLGRYMIAVLNDKEAGYPLVIAPTDGSEEPMRLVSTVDNMDPTLVSMGSKIRLMWVALDLSRPEDRRYRVVHLADFDLSELGAVAGLGAGGSGARGG
jgi:Tol biopolymer transport system component